MTWGCTASFRWDSSVGLGCPTASSCGPARHWRALHRCPRQESFEPQCSYFRSQPCYIEVRMPSADFSWDSKVHGSDFMIYWYHRRIEVLCNDRIRTLICQMQFIQLIIRRNTFRPHLCARQRSLSKCRCKICCQPGGLLRCPQRKDRSGFHSELRVRVWRLMCIKGDGLLW